MRPTITEMLAGIADALADTTDSIDDLRSRHQVAAAAAALRRIAVLVPVLPRHLLVDAGDLAAALDDVAPELASELAAEVGNVVCELEDIDLRATTLDELQAVHQRVLDLFDAALRDPAARRPDIDAPLRSALERSVAREASLGASIAGR